MGPGPVAERVAQQLRPAGGAARPVEARDGAGRGQLQELLRRRREEAPAPLEQVLRRRPVAGEGPLGLVALGPLVEDGVEEGLDAGEVVGEVGKFRREHLDRVRDDAAPRRVAARDDVAQLLDLRAHGGLHERRVDDAEAAREGQA